MIMKRYIYSIYNSLKKKSCLFCSSVCLPTSPYLCGVCVCVCYAHARRRCQNFCFPAVHFSPRAWVVVICKPPIFSTAPLSSGDRGTCSVLFLHRCRGY